MTMTGVAIVEGQEWKPHYLAQYSHAQMEIFRREPHPFIDSRCILARFKATGIEVVTLEGEHNGLKNPINLNRKILVKPTGFYMPGEGPLLPLDFVVWTITIPLIDGHAHVFKGGRDKTTGQYRVWKY